MRGQSLYDYCMEHEDKKYLLDEWDYEKNEQELGLSPKDISRGSGKKVYWKCEKGHEYEAVIGVKMTQGTGCPYCSGNKVLSGFNDLETTHPELLKDWDYERNSILPSEITSGSDKKVWWVCEKGHHYDSIVGNRTRLNVGCSYCSGKGVLKGFNDLETIYPNIAKEWHPTKNGNLTPDKVTKGSKLRVWWLCKFCGYEWKTSIHCRTGQNTNCPQCNKEKRSSFPEQAIYYYLKQVYKEVLNGSVNLLRGKLELDIYIPEIKTAIEYDGVKWHKDINKDLKKNKLCQEKGIRLIRIREEGLPDIEGSVNIFRKVNRSDIDLDNVLCKLFSLLDIEVDVNIERDRQKIYSQYIQSEKENSLTEKFPEIAKQWHPTKNGSLIPDNLSYASNKKVWWLCDKGHEYNSSVSHRTGGGTGCSYCSGQKVLKGFNDLCTTHPDLIKEWNYEKNGDLTPDKVTKGSIKKVWWLCDKGHEYESTVANKSRGKGCPYCSGQKVLKGFNDLIMTHPDLVKEWDYSKNKLSPVEISKGSNKKVWWLCSKGHSFEMKVSQRTGQGAGCPYCSGHKVLKGYNDLVTTHPDLIKEWNYEKNGELTPDKVSKGCNKKVWWKCDKGHEYEMMVCDRTINNSGCSFCSSKKVLKGFNDLCTTHPELIKEWHPTKNGSLTPYMVSKGSDKKVWWVCEKGHEFEQSISSRTTKNCNCPYCSNKKVLAGFNDLATTHPELIKEWNYAKNDDLTPDRVSAGSGKKVWWKCLVCDNEWFAIVNKRISGCGCPECGKKKQVLNRIVNSVKNGNDLASNYPEVLKDWDYDKNDILPVEVLSFSNKRVWWKCKVCGCEWNARIATRTKSGTGCPECGKKKCVESRRKNKEKNG